MVAAGGMLQENGYTTRVWMALKAVRKVQSTAVPRPVLLSFESPRTIRHSQLRGELQQKAKASGVELIIRTLLPKRLPFSDVLNLRVARRAVRHVVARHGIGVVHGQSHAAAAYALGAVRLSPAPRTVFDVHGADIAERLSDGRLVRGTSLYARALRRQKETWTRASERFVVSKELGEHIRTATGENVPYHVVPCVNTLNIRTETLEDMRRRARQKLGFTESNDVILYLGGASDWQQPKLLLKVFRELRNLNPAAQLLILSAEPEYFQTRIETFGIERNHCRILSVPHQEVSNIASAADLGVLIRQDHVINRVASPTKFAEYLNLGVPVLLTDAVADFSRIVRNNGIGIEIGCNDSPKQIAATTNSFLKSVRETRSMFRKRCRETADEQLSFESILSTYQRIYGE